MSNLPARQAHSPASRRFAEPSSRGGAPFFVLYIACLFAYVRLVRWSSA